MVEAWQLHTRIDALRRRTARCVCAALLLICSLPAASQPATPDAAALSAPPRPRIALVLSGGGARGFAHVGVLRALKDLQVPIDIVTGASMGAVVGGAYAAGRTVEELEDFVRGTDWTELLADRPPRDALDFRRREDDLLVPSHIEFGIGRSGAQLPPGTVGNAVLEAALMRLLPSGASELPVNRLALPFRCVASDLLTGTPVELAETPLFASMRASLAMPGVFAPIRVNGRLLVDGGLVRNLPVDIARAMGAQVIIAVNVGTPLAGEEELSSSIGVARQMLQILTEQNVQRSLQELTARDVLIAPDLDGISFMNFGLSERAIAAGERAARALAPRLQALAVSAEAYVAIEAKRVAAAAAADSAQPIARLDVRATPHAGSPALAARLGLRVGDRVTAAQVQQAATGLLGGGDFERVEVDVRDADGLRQVTITPVEAGWARSRVRLGLELGSDFADDHPFTVSALHLLSWLNTWGGEVRTLARVGSVRSLAIQPWQPLGPGSPWHLVPSIQYRASSLDVYENRVRTQRVAYEVTIGTLALGRQFGNWGNVQLGVDRRVGRARALLVTDASRTGARLGETARYAQFQIDTLDSLALPSRGVLLQGRVERLRAQPGQAGRGSSSWVGMQAFRIGGWASHGYAEWSRSRSDLAPLSLGGFLRLSGTPRESVEARELVLGRLTMARRIGDMPAGLGGALRTGFSLELGGGYDRDKTSERGDLQRAGAIFVSVDTRFGPVFIALGATRHVGSAIYLFLGPFW